MHKIIPYKYYFISKFDKKNIKKQDKRTAIIYRNYDHQINKQEIVEIRNFCKKNNLIFLLSNNIKLAVNLNLDGAYLPSFNNSKKHLSYNLKKKFFIVGSAHNIREIRNKERQKVNAIFLSSLFKRNKNFLNLNKFILLSKITKKKVIALGGISKKNIRKLKLVNAFGFAGISYFE